MKKKILITGISGFIGSALARYIGESKIPFEVYGITRGVRNPLKNTFTCDLNQRKRLRSLLEHIRPGYIFHLAGGRTADVGQVFDTNFTATQSLLDTVKKIKNYRPRLIVPGSAAEYGKPRKKGLISEKCAPEPLSWYGFVKLLQTNLCVEYSKAGMDVVVGRIFNIMGKETPETLAAGGFARQIAMMEKGKADKVLRTKNLSSTRDFLDIDDVCSALILIARAGKAGEVYNVCSGRAVSMRDLLKQLLLYAKVKNIILVENKKASQPTFDIIGSNRKLKLLGQWSAKVSAAQSLRNTLQSYRQRPGN